MLINMQPDVDRNIKFVSYTGAYPNLCTGELTLLVNGKEYVFGNKYEKPLNHARFWRSSGSCFPSCTSGEWEIDVSALPNELRRYAAEIDYVFNENVEFGCCGGCL